MDSSELAELNLAVGRALVLDVKIEWGHCIRNLPYDPLIGAGDFVGYSPSTDWSQGGPIIERERITIWPLVSLPGVEGATWRACSDDDKHHSQEGPTPLIAAMRAFVASKK